MSSQINVFEKEKKFRLGSHRSENGFWWTYIWVDIYLGLGIDLGLDIYLGMSIYLGLDIYLGYII
jgi:hypothetical protein